MNARRRGAENASANAATLSGKDPFVVTCRTRGRDARATASATASKSSRRNGSPPLSRTTSSGPSLRKTLATSSGVISVPGFMRHESHMPQRALHR